jgi:hypothetical protein
MSDPSRLDTITQRVVSIEISPWLNFVTPVILVTVWFRLDSFSVPDFHDRLGLSVRLMTRKTR